MIDRDKILLLILESLGDKIISQYQLDSIIDNIEQLDLDLSSYSDDIENRECGKHSPELYEGDNSNCDMLQGPCSCGAWHSIKDWDFDSIDKKIENNEYRHIY